MSKFKDFFKEVIDVNLKAKNISLNENSKIETDINQNISSNLKTLEPDKSLNENLDNAYISDEEFDEYFGKAVNFVVSKQKASVSMLQKQFRLGYNHASRIMDELEETGVVGPEEGSKPRKVLFDMKHIKNFSPKRIKNNPETTPDMNGIYSVTNGFIKTGLEFEKFCAYTLSYNGFLDISVTKGSGDFGIDIIAKKDGITYGIQCKYYNSSVGVDAVQEAHSGKEYYHLMVGAIFTNSNFTRAAIDMASKLNILLWDKEYIEKNFNYKYINQNIEPKQYKPSKDDSFALAEKMVNAFKNFGLYIKILKINIDHEYTVYHLVKEDSVKIKTIYSLQNDIQLIVKCPFKIETSYETGTFQFIFSNHYVSGYSIKYKTD